MSLRRRLLLLHRGQGRTLEVKMELHGHAHQVAHGFAAVGLHAFVLGELLQALDYELKEKAHTHLQDTERYIQT